MSLTWSQAPEDRFECDVDQIFLVYLGELLFFYIYPGKDIEPYLPKLMEHLITVLKTSPSIRPKELAISAIGATGE